MGKSMSLFREHALKLSRSVVIPSEDCRGRERVSFFNWRSATATQCATRRFRIHSQRQVIRRWNPRFTTTSAIPPQKALARDVGAHPIDQNVLSIHPRGFRTRQESHNGRNIVDRSDTLQRVYVRKGCDDLFWLSLSEQRSIDSTWCPSHVSKRRTGCRGANRDVPGETVLTVIPFAPSSLARTRENCSMAPLVAA